MADRRRFRQLVRVLASTALVVVVACPRGAEADVTQSHQARKRPPGRRTSQAHVVPGGQVEVNRPRTIFDCDTPRGEAWYGSTKRCLAELCAGGNFTNRYIDGTDDRLRKNPCYGLDPYELQR
jgi:hypothetical protein